MGRELKKINLNEVSEPKVDQPKKTKKVVPKKISDNVIKSKPSPYETDLRVKLRDKSMLNLGNIPTFVKDIFEAQAKENGMNHREYFYYLLREQGGDIPPYDQMDGRKL